MGTAIDTGESAHGVVTGLPRLLLRSEGVALLVMAAVLYGKQGQSWWLFVALLAVPDLGLIGYLVGTQAGAVAYNLTHTYVPPAVLALCAVLGGSSLAVSAALIWFAHIGAAGRQPPWLGSGAGAGSGTAGRSLAPRRTPP
jgi:hypothetical protein